MLRILRVCQRSLSIRRSPPSFPRDIQTSRYHTQSRPLSGSSHAQHIHRQGSSFHPVIPSYISHIPARQRNPFGNTVVRGMSTSQSKEQTSFNIPQLTVLARTLRTYSQRKAAQIRFDLSTRCTWAQFLINRYRRVITFIEVMLSLALIPAIDTIATQHYTSTPAIVHAEYRYRPTIPTMNMYVNDDVLFRNLDAIQTIIHEESSKSLYTALIIDDLIALSHHLHTYQQENNYDTTYSSQILDSIEQLKTHDFEPIYHHFLGFSQTFQSVGKRTRALITALHQHPALLRFVYNTPCISTLVHNHMLRLNHRLLECHNSFDPMLQVLHVIAHAVNVIDRRLRQNIQLPQQEKPVQTPHEIEQNAAHVQELFASIEKHRMNIDDARTRYGFRMNPLNQFPLYQLNNSLDKHSSNDQHNTHGSYSRQESNQSQMDNPILLMTQQIVDENQKRQELLALPPTQQQKHQPVVIQRQQKLKRIEIPQDDSFLTPITDGISSLFSTKPTVQMVHSTSSTATPTQQQRDPFKKQRKLSNDDEFLDDPLTSKKRLSLDYLTTTKHNH